MERRRPSASPVHSFRWKRRGTSTASQRRAAWLFLAPSLLVLGVFVVYPMAQALYLSFTDYDILQPPKWIGIANYVGLTTDPTALNAMSNTLVYALATTICSVALALTIAVLLNHSFRFRSLARTAVFLPFITSLAVVSIAFTYLVNPDIGLVSYWGSLIGIQSQGWLVDPNLAMPSVIVVGIWKYVGFYVIMYLAGLQSIPRELHEAAMVDGAGPLRRFRHITWPLLSNQTLLITIVATVTNVQAFDQIYVMTRGGPFFKTDTLVMMIYRTGFNDLQFGYAAALSFVLVALLMVLALAQVAYFRRKAVRYL